MSLDLSLACAAALAGKSVEPSTPVSDLFTPADTEASVLLTALASGGCSAATSALLSSNASMLRALLNIGVRTSRAQASVYEAVAKDEAVTQTLSLLKHMLSSRFFLSGAGHRAGALDGYVFGKLYNLLSLAFPASLAKPEVEEVMRWFTTVYTIPAVHDVLSAAGLLTGGQVREGGQIDLRPVAARVPVLVEVAIAKNAGHKKAASQRDAEHAKKETPAPAAAPAAAAAAAGAGASAPASGVVATAKQPETNKTLPEKSVEERIAMTSAKLNELSIAHEVVRHAPAVKVEDMLAAIGSLPGTKAKNLFLKAKKEKAPGDSRLWLVVAAHDSDVSLTGLATKLGYGKIVLRFGEADTLVENLGVVQGHVSPFALMNDTALQVNVALDARLLAEGADPLYFHPLTNEASVAIKAADFVKFLNATGHAYTVVDFASK